MKGTYEPIEGKVPFGRCQEKHPPFTDEKLWLVRSDDIEMSIEGHPGLEADLNKGKRYSTLVSDRQSVLNALVEPVL